MIKELRSVGAVEQLASGKLRVLKRHYIPRELSANQIRLWGDILEDLGTTLEHNLMRERTEAPRFERRAISLTVERKSLTEFEAFLAEQGQAFLERIDDWLAAHQADPSTSGRGTPLRLGVGVYQILDRPWPQGADRAERPAFLAPEKNNEQDSGGNGRLRARRGAGLLRWWQRRSGTSRPGAAGDGGTAGATSSCGLGEGTSGIEGTGLRRKLTGRITDVKSSGAGSNTVVTVGTACFTASGASVFQGSAPASLADLRVDQIIAAEGEFDSTSANYANTIYILQGAGSPSPQSVQELRFAAQRGVNDWGTANWGPEVVLEPSASVIIDGVSAGAGDLVVAADEIALVTGDLLDPITTPVAFSVATA